MTASLSFPGGAFLSPHRAEEAVAQRDRQHITELNSNQTQIYYIKIIVPFEPLLLFSLPSAVLFQTEFVPVVILLVLYAINTLIHITIL